MSHGYERENGETKKEYDKFINSYIEYEKECNKHPYKGKSKPFWKLW